MSARWLDLCILVTYKTTTTDTWSKSHDAGWTEETHSHLLEDVSYWVMQSGGGHDSCTQFFLLSFLLESMFTRSPLNHGCLFVAQAIERVTETKTLNKKVLSPNLCKSMAAPRQVWRVVLACLLYKMVARKKQPSKHIKWIFFFIFYFWIVYDMHSFHMHLFCLFTVMRTKNILLIKMVFFFVIHRVMFPEPVSMDQNCVPSLS